MTGKTIGGVTVFIAATLWGLIGLFVKPLLAIGFERAELIFFRAAITAFCVLGVLWKKDRMQVKIHLKDCWIFVGMGVLSFVCFNMCYLQSIAISGMGIAAVLLYTAPIFVMIFSAILFKERITQIKLLALILALCGCVLVTGIIGDGQTKLSIVGILLGLGSGLGYSLYTIFGQYGLARYPSLTVTGWAFFFGAIGSLPFVRFNHMFSVIKAYPQSVLLLIGLGVLINVIPYVLYTYGLSRMEGSQASIIACVEPAVATAAGVVIYHEALSFFAVIGILMILSAVVLLNVKNKKEILNDL